MRANLRVPLAGLFLFLTASLSCGGPPRFTVTFSEKAHGRPYTGRVYLFFSKSAEPRHGPNWFRPEPMVAREVTDWKPGEPLEFTAGTQGLLAFPKPLSELALDGLKVQALARFNPWEREVGTGPGNGFSAIAKVEGDAVTLDITEIVPESKFAETKWSKLLEVPSPLLSEFHKRPVSTRAGIVLPGSYYDEPERRYPVIYSIPGFGGTHSVASGKQEPGKEHNPKGVEFIRVFLDPSCPLGHHVFADSANNGPVGTALVREFIPALEARFRAVARPTARFVTGHSSGGWSSLWLQVAYPDTFGGTWSTAPDPVDFRDFQRIDMYAGENMYKDPQGERRPIARVGERPILWYDDFDRMEWVCGYGGQLHSFEAVFSPRGTDGRPRLAWSRETGQVDLETAKAWEAYDIRLILERRWPELGPKLAGKLHVIMGGLDTFYLEGATRRLGETLKTLDSDAVVEIVPGKSHGADLLTPELRTRLAEEMAAAYLKHATP